MLRKLRFVVTCLRCRLQWCNVGALLGECPDSDCSSDALGVEVVA